MISATHASHIKQHTSHANCSECRADTERRFVPTQVWTEYKFVSEYLGYVRPRLAAVKTKNSTEARIWYRQFIKALHRRISLRNPASGRKQCDSYLERMGQSRRCSDAGYLRQFARRGASALDY